MLRPKETTQAEQLLDLILDTASCECSDGRDRIYALFSLLRTASDETLIADYTLSAEQVYCGTAAFIENGFLGTVFTLATRIMHVGLADVCHHGSQTGLRSEMECVKLFRPMRSKVATTIFGMHTPGIDLHWTHQR